MLQMRKVFYAFAIVLIALIITPNAIMRVSACADCDDDDPITLSDRLANIAPSLAEINFDVLLADAVQDRYEEELFIVISMQEGQVDIVSVKVVNNDQLGLLSIYTDDGVELLILTLKNQSCIVHVLDSVGYGMGWHPYYQIWIAGVFWRCRHCPFEIFIFVHR